MRRAYDQWHEVLSEEFFGADHALQSTVLYVDDEVERELAERNGIDTPLAQAVADEMYWEGSDRALLWRILSQCPDPSSPASLTCASPCLQRNWRGAKRG